MNNPLSSAFADIRIEQGLAENATLFAQHCEPLLEKVEQADKPLILGLSGPQGCGKTSLAQSIARLFQRSTGLQVLVLSLDDFYLTLAERKRLADEVHLLSKTRGVPGTHDLTLLSQVLRSCLTEKSLEIPRFDKSKDDRAGFTEVKGPFDLVIFEGWCLGAKPDPLISPALNVLEESEDPQGIWRCWVEDNLKRYQELFAQVDLWAYLSAPDWPIVAKWREAQERDLRRAGRAAPMLEPGRLERFMMFYQRITLRMLEQMPATADWYAQLDSNQQIISVTTQGR